jgi:tetratricopeptide (TPR) repeat protein
MANDWCNKKTWNEADKADFFSRLSRRGDKVKYLSLQASGLEEVGSPELLAAAITLWDQLIVELTNDTTFTHHKQLAAAYNRKAACYLKLGDVDNSITAYRRVFAIERESGSPATLAFFDFGRLVAEKNLRHHFDEALSALDAGAKYIGKHLPADTFNFYGIRALIAARKGETEKAKDFARLALEAARKDNSGIRNHPKFGLVDNRESKFLQSIEAIVTAEIHSFSN